MQVDIPAAKAKLHKTCRGMFDRETIGKMKKGAYLINTARGAIADCDAVKEACESGQLGGGAPVPLVSYMHGLLTRCSPQAKSPVHKPSLLYTHVSTMPGLSVVRTAVY